MKGDNILVPPLRGGTPVWALCVPTILRRRAPRTAFPRRAWERGADKFGETARGSRSEGSEWGSPLPHRATEEHFSIRRVGVGGELIGTREEGLRAATAGERRSAVARIRT